MSKNATVDAAKKFVVNALASMGESIGLDALKKMGPAEALTAMLRDVNTRQGALHVEFIRGNWQDFVTYLSSIMPRDTPAVQPLWDYCLLEMIEPAETAGGIVLPESSRGQMNDTQLCRCVAAGPGAWRDSGEMVPNPIKVGDVVYRMTRMQPFTMVVNEKTYMMTSARDVVAIVPRSDRQED